LSTLALLGGTPVREKLFPGYNVIGTEEVEAIREVAASGVLSRFLGTWHGDFYGGQEVQAFEREWAAAYDAQYAVSVNSNTSGLFAAMGAAGVGPGDEVIVSPYTMSASAIAPVIFNAVPVFADIDPHTYTLTAETIEARITPRTRAVIVVHIFGMPADMDPIMALAKKHDLVIIEDCAQAPCATYRGRPVGTLGHMGVFSLNYHKHIHTGEGGVIVTNDARLAEKLQLIRNHGENVVEGKGVTDIVNMLGFNFRLGEMEAALGRKLIPKAPKLVSERRDNVAYLNKALAGLTGVTTPYEPSYAVSSYYVHVLDYEAAALGVTRASFVKAVKAELAPCERREQEGVLVFEGYVRPLYLQPLYQKRIAYGETGCPFSCPHYTGTPDYSRGSCANVERAHFERVIGHELMRPPMTKSDLDDVVDAFAKVVDNIDALRDWEKSSR